MRFKRFTFSLLSPIIGFHVGKNPVSGQRFVHIAPFPFIGIDFDLPPYNLNDKARNSLIKSTPPGHPADYHNDGFGEGV